MTGFVELTGIAFVAQLAALPGEKVQFIIAGLSTQYDPKIVVAAATTAFAIWTAIEIAVGDALRSALPGVYLDAVTGALFFVFGLLLLRSMPADGNPGPMQGDGGIVALGGRFEQATILGRDIPTYFGGFLPIFAMMFAGEFGDKTQMVTIGLAVQYGASPAIWAGEMAAIVPVSLLNAMFFARFSRNFDARRAHLAAAALFFFFAGDVALQLAFDVSVWETVVAAAARLLPVAVSP